VDDVDEMPTIVAPNGTVVEPGGVYLTFSGDEDLPYAVVKVISVGCGPGVMAADCRITPDPVPVRDPDVWLKIYFGQYSERPDGPNAQMLSAGSRIVPVSVSAFLAWGPPKFPIRVSNEAVTAEELAACVEG
jgi:hypothetical protein